MTPYECMEKAEEINLIIEAMGRINQRHARALALRYLGGDLLTFREVGERMAISGQTAYIMVETAIFNIRRELKIMELRAFKRSRTL